jgi:hypothetical protein
MRLTVKKVIRGLAPLAFLQPEGRGGIAKLGHRDYVGGLWEEIGQLQFQFLLSKGLTSDSYLLDIACGSLRLGVKAIPYLERSHYLGIEKESGLVEAGLERELDPELIAEKQPKIVISDLFEFEKLGRRADFAIAQSLFTHLPSALIDLCFKKLYPWVEGAGVFYATFSRTEQRVHNPKRPHAHGRFAYTQAEMLSFGERNGFASNYIGDWNHPRSQVMVEYRKTEDT